MLIIPTPAQNSLGTSTAMIITAGEYVAQALTVTNNGVALNITGYSAKMRINLSTPLDLTTGNGGIILTTPASGILTINIPVATSVAMAPGSYPYDLWIEDASGHPTQLLAGNFVVNAAVTPLP